MSSLNKKGVLIQARMGSVRLKGKSLLPLDESINVMEAVYARCSKSIKTDLVAFCISDNSIDDILANFLEAKGYNFIRGNENNLVKRFYEACENYQINQFVRVTGDNPLVDPEVIDYFFDQDKSVDFVDGYSPKQLPNGTVVSRLSNNILIRLMEDEKDAEHLEHVVTSPLIINKLIPDFPDKWKNPNVRYCLDNDSDYETLKKLFTIKNILEFSTADLINIYPNISPENLSYADEGY